MLDWLKGRSFAQTRTIPTLSGSLKPPKAVRDREDVLASAVRDTASGEVVWRQLNGDFVTG
jgi:hypothetical protein